MTDTTREIISKLFIEHSMHTNQALINDLVMYISQKNTEENIKLLLELLQVFNDYDVPLTMTAEQVRDILEEYLTKKE